MLLFIRFETPIKTSKHKICVIIFIKILVHTNNYCTFGKQSATKLVLNFGNMKSKKQKVKILGQEVTVGTKLHAKLVAQVKHFNDLSSYE